jgi:electron transport complex protein RnfE
MRICDPQVHASLGIFVPLIAANCLIHHRSGSVAARSPVALSCKDALGVGTGFLVALLLISAVREMFGNGTLLGHVLLGNGFHDQPITLIALPAGAFLVFAFLMIGFSGISRKAGP